MTNRLDAARLHPLTVRVAIAATVLAFFIGYAVIAWLLRYISTHDFRIFVLYRLILAAVVAVLILTGVLSA